MYLKIVVVCLFKSMEWYREVGKISDLVGDMISR